MKIIDFGLSEKYVLADDESIKKGTLFYMAPEVVSNGKITKSVDMWAVGIIIFQLLSGGEHPYSVTSIDPKDKNGKILGRSLHHREARDIGR